MSEQFTMLDVFPTLSEEELAEVTGGTQNVNGTQVFGFIAGAAVTGAGLGAAGGPVGMLAGGMLGALWGGGSGILLYHFLG